LIKIRTVDTRSEMNEAQIWRNTFESYQNYQRKNLPCRGSNWSLSGPTPFETMPTVGATHQAIDLTQLRKWIENLKPMQYLALLKHDGCPLDKGSCAWKGGNWTKCEPKNSSQCYCQPQHPKPPHCLCGAPWGNELRTLLAFKLIPKVQVQRRALIIGQAEDSKIFNTKKACKKNAADPDGVLHMAMDLLDNFWTITAVQSGIGPSLLGCKIIGIGGIIHTEEPHKVLDLIRKTTHELYGRCNRDVWGHKKLHKEMHCTNWRPTKCYVANFNRILNFLEITDSVQADTFHVTSFAERNEFIARRIVLYARSHKKWEILRKLLKRN